MSSIEIKKINIIELQVDAIVNAANTGLWEGDGVCGDIFQAAGYEDMNEVCNAYGHCDEGSAIITPGFKLPAKHVIHAVGPKWVDGEHGEPEILYSAYMISLELAMDNAIHTIGLPLISAGIFGYPKEKAWDVAITATKDFFNKHPDYNMDVTFAVIDDVNLELGKKTLESKNV